MPNHGLDVDLIQTGADFAPGLDTVRALTKRRRNRRTAGRVVTAAVVLIASFGTVLNVMNRGTDRVETTVFATSVPITVRTPDTGTTTAPMRDLTSEDEPNSSAGGASITDEEYGYSFSVPAGFDAREFTNGAFNYFSPSTGINLSVFGSPDIAAPGRRVGDVQLPVIQRSGAVTLNYVERYEQLGSTQDGTKTVATNIGTGAYWIVIDVSGGSAAAVDQVVEMVISSLKTRAPE